MAPEFIFREHSSPNLHYHHRSLDFGATQSDALTVDRRASLLGYQKLWAQHDELVQREATFLAEVGAAVVAVDIAPIACAAAHMARVPAVVVTNFSWDFIYAEYVQSEGQIFRKLLDQIALDYGKASLLLRLPGYMPMPAFRQVQDVPLVVRMAKRSRSEVRKQYGIAEDAKVVIYNFGGQPTGWEMKHEFLPEGWICVVCTGLDMPKGLPSNFIKPPNEAYTPDLIEASDVMLGKVGYGTTSEAVAHSKPFVFIRRDYFNEQEYLLGLLRQHKLAHEMSRADFYGGSWGPALEAALKETPQKQANGPLLDTHGGLKVAEVLLDIARATMNAPAEHKFGANDDTALRGTIVAGYLLRKAAAESEPDPRGLGGGIGGVGSKPSVGGIGGAGGGLEVLEGLPSSLQRDDTKEFLALLRHLASDAVHSGLRECKGLFKFGAAQPRITVGRAPGRLDLMGGIADYSGSLVLQIPTKEACFVAVQRQLPAAGQPPMLRIASLGAVERQRAPTYTTPICDLLPLNSPLTYEAARKFFASDPSSHWAGYVAGVLVVLAREKGLQLPHGVGLSILVSSQVPEGKGVSSSASVEVATMIAVSQEFGVLLAPTEVAVLSQKVENHVVGAPCGIMDQMASALGEEDRLLVLQCQPHKVLGMLALPMELQVWGIDSGIKHSVGGTDYGSVRTATFMGLSMIHSQAASASAYATEKYLANLAPSDFCEFAPNLPETLLGRDFLEKFPDGTSDPITTVSSDRAYHVRVCATHPVMEHFRVNHFRQLLADAHATATDTAASDMDEVSQRGCMLGELMYQSHKSYGQVGLGSEGTDRLVALVRGAGPGSGLFGAKITGGGSGGTVAVLGLRGVHMDTTVQRLADVYQKEYQHQPYIFRGSSPGAVSFGHITLSAAVLD